MLVVLASAAAAAVLRAGAPNTTGPGSQFPYYQARGPHAVASTKVKVNALSATVWYPTDVPAGQKIQPMVYSDGTASPASSYSDTAEHVASHGFAAMYIAPVTEVPKKDHVWGIEWFRGEHGALPAEIAGRVDVDNIAGGGHSGGGPPSITGTVDELQGGRGIKAYIGQHVAFNGGIGGVAKAVAATGPIAALQLCGSTDSIEPCPTNGKPHYYDKYAGPRMLIMNPNGHFAGVWGKTGDQFEGGQIVAFLYYTLRGVTEARAALNACPSSLKGTVTVTDDLDHGRGPVPPPPAPAGDRYHCDTATQSCAKADSGHSSLAKCEAACVAPAPPTPPAPPAAAYACVVSSGQKLCQAVPASFPSSYPTLAGCQQDCR